MARIQFIKRCPDEGASEFIKRAWKTMNPALEPSDKGNQLPLVYKGYDAPYPTARRLRAAIMDDNAPVWMSEHYEGYFRQRTVWYVYEMGWPDGTPSRVAYAVMAEASVT